MARAPVVLNVYNMYWLNEYTAPIGLGVYHSGVEVYGKEYAFGGHPFDFTGIFDVEPRDSNDLGEGFSFKESVPLGLTDFSEDDVAKAIEMLGAKYVGAAYHLVKNNCNHFTDEFSQLLCGKRIPGWVNRLATIGTRFPFLCACIPKQWLTPDVSILNEYVDLTEWEQIDGPATDGDGSAVSSLSLNLGSGPNTPVYGWSSSSFASLSGSASPSPGPTEWSGRESSYRKLDN